MSALTNRGRVWVVVLTVMFVLGVSSVTLAHQGLLTLQKDPKQWVMPNGNYSGWNYSGLDQINLSNIQNLTMAWSMQLGILDAHEASPLVIGNTMYIVTPKPNYVYALDLTRDGAIKWEFRPEIQQIDAAIKAACCGAETRGLAYADGKIFYSTLDGQIFALNAEDGKVVWRAENANIAIGETASAMPLIVNDKVIVGVMGGEKGVRGHVTAYNINTGSMRWRYYSMGPNNEVGIGPRFKPFYADDKVPNPALDSWYGDSWKRGGGTIWGWFTFDPDLNLFYYGTSNCSPWNPDYRRKWGEVDLDARGGLASYRNNYCSSILARDADSGELVWAYNLTPQDAWDLDEPSAGIIVDLQIGGRMRKTLVHPARNGFYYVFDRATGEMLLKPWPFVYNDLIKGVDMETGRTLYDIRRIMFTKLEDRQKYVPDAKDTTVTWCPGIAARNWFQDAYSPRTGLIYTPASNQCGTQKMVEGKFVPGADYTLRETVGNTNPLAPGAESAGELQANDPVTGKTVWRVPWKVANNAPVMATAGDLLFQGGPNEGVFRAFNARTGQIVWTFRTGSNFRSSPISYAGPDGRQYVAIIGSQLGPNTRVQPDAAPDADIRFRRSGATLYVFALPRSVAGTAK
ncbi:MAG: PQQ-dependent dehydrogenase, methanol/ethanol family [Acidobacteria bacterium]|nr:MAG: PQQ-dependent dehydrogenase, methanol/ethanol family [Acidobacteriota bacterium]